MRRVHFKSRRNQVIAHWFTKEARRKVYIKDGEILEDVEPLQGKKITFFVLLDDLIDHFNRCDQRRKAIELFFYVFTDFGFGFMAGVAYMRMLEEMKRMTPYGVIRLKIAFGEAKHHKSFKLNLYALGGVVNGLSKSKYKIKT